MLQGRHQHEIVRSINILACVTFARGGRLLDNMVNFIHFLGLADIPLQLFERFWAIELGLDVGEFATKPPSGLSRRHLRLQRQSGLNTPDSRLRKVIPASRD